MLGSATGVYTCLNSYLSEDQKTYLSKFNPYMTRVNFKLPQKQNNVFSCGVFTDVGYFNNSTA
jgi:Ulp1 family protease